MLETVLPQSEQIYFKEFHFLDEPLIERNKSFDKTDLKKSQQTLPITLDNKPPLKLKEDQDDSTKLPMFSN